MILDPNKIITNKNSKIQKKNETGTKVSVFDARTENEEWQSKESVNKKWKQAESNIKSDRSLNNRLNTWSWKDSKRLWLLINWRNFYWNQFRKQLN